MPITPYSLNDTFTNQRFGNVSQKPTTFRGKSRALGDWISTDADYTSLINQLPQTLIQLYQAGRTTDVQDQLLQLNIQRAQQGKAPISLEMVGGASLVQPGVNVSLSPETKQMLMIGGAGLAAILLMKRKGKRR